MSDLNDLNKPVTTDTEPNVLDTLRAHIVRAATWTGYASTANKVAGLMTAVTAAVTGGRSLRLYRRNDANTADEEVVSLPGVSVGGNAATASAAQAGSTLETVLAAKAPLNSPALTGTPTVPTAAAGTNTTQAASTAFVATAVANVVNTAPAALDTLNELAASLGNDPNFATTMTTALGNRVVRATATRPGVTKLYRSDDDSAFNLQTTWQTDKTGFWSLRGYLDNTYHAPVYVGYAGQSDSATKINSQGQYAATAPGTTRGEGGVNLYEAYNNSYPTTYGNVLHLRGAGATQLLLGWSVTDGAHADNYIRSKRDNDTGAWSPWAKLITDQNIGSQSVNYSATSGNAALLNGKTEYDLFGAISTTGTLDWNHVSNTKPGSGPTLLLGTSTNGPGTENYYHAFNFEFGSKNGTGNVTQLAIPYSSPVDTVYIRGRYSGTWSAWRKMLTSDNLLISMASVTTVGGVGTYAFLSPLQNSNYPTGGIQSGSNLYFRAAYAAQDHYTGPVQYIYFGSSPAGSWMLMGYIYSSDSANHANTPSLWFRIA